jgi:hypothetical protein
MAVVATLSELRKVLPTLLNRSLRLEIRNQEEEKLLNIRGQLPQASLNLPLD